MIRLAILLALVCMPIAAKTLEGRIYCKYPDGEIRIQKKDDYCPSAPVLGAKGKEEKLRIETQAQNFTHKLLGLALLFGIAAKFLKRPFMAGFVTGGILYAVFALLVPF